MQYKTLGIIIKRTNIGEADRILTIITKDYGKIRVKAKGIRKTLSKLAGHMELFCVTDFVIAEGKVLDIVTSAQVKKCHHELRGDMSATRIAYYLAEITERMLAENEKHENVFCLFDETLEHLNKGPLPLIVSFFELNFLAMIGFKPELEKCLVCGKRISEGNNVFDSEHGGLVCCESKMGMIISDKAIKALRLILRHDFAVIKKIKADQELIKEIEKISTQYLKHINQSELKSERFLLR